MDDLKDSTETGTGAKRTLSLKKTVGAGQVRQSFSHGRTKAVVVERKRKRTLNVGEDAAAAETDQAPAEQGETTPDAA
ncbi:MAG TPA: hypothetical protein DCO82_08895, partial [Alphaproteobacteria bacterium]|nr:hypothetical protein [Alphaproteobacteria bacterium]